MKATDRHKLIDRIKTLDVLTDDERSTLLGLLRESKTYGLVWEDKPEEVEERLRNELPILKEVPSRAIISDNPEAPNHILIEGDNLEALTTLAYTHAGKIDVIYIDPPYNTGNKDFIYNDSYVDTEDSYRHSKWLSFMSKRLKIAKKLLSDRGIIFISIDDNEINNLRLLMDDKDKGLFGEENFIAQLIWQKKKGGGNDSRFVATEHEYVLMYAKNSRNLDNIFIPYGSEYLSRYKEEDEKGRYFWDTFKRKSGKQYYAIECPDGSLLEKEDNGEPISWLRSKPRFLQDLADGEARIIKIKDKWTVHFKQRQPEGYKPRSIMTDVGTTSIGADLLKELFNVTRLFDNPKPLELISFLIKFGKKDYKVLDFFAGSGTTLHAVMQLNAEDGGNRQCILCTNNENGICENVTYERNKRVINGYTKPDGEHVEGLHNNNLRYYRTDFVGRERSLRNMQRLVNLSTDMLCIKENLHTEQKEMAGVKTHPQIFRLFDDGKRQMLIIYREEYISEIVGLIDKMDVAQPMKVYVFSPSEDPASDLFEPVADKVKPTALPAAIYNTYKRLLPKRKPQPIDTVGMHPGASSGEGASSDEDDEFGGLLGAIEKGGDE